MRDNAKSGALTEVTFYILLSLYTPKHGYAVMQFVEEKTGGRLSLGAGTLYGALNSLQDKKWIEPYGDSEGRKKEYHITAQGKEIAEKELATVYKGNIIKNLIMDCQSYAKYRPNETTGGIFVSWRRKEELPTGA